MQIADDVPKRGEHKRSKLPNKGWEVKRVRNKSISSVLFISPKLRRLGSKSTHVFNKVRVFGTFLADGKIKSTCLRSHSFFDVGNYDLSGHIPTLSKSISVVLSLVKMPPVALLLELLSCQQCS